MEYQSFCSFFHSATSSLSPILAIIMPLNAGKASQGKGVPVEE
jgi:hypothetical protein